MGEETHLGRATPKRRGPVWGRVPLRGEVCSKGEKQAQGGGASHRRRACLWGGPPFSPGLHGASLAGVHIPDVAGRVNKELKLGQR